MSIDYSKVRGEVVTITPIEANRILSEHRISNCESEKWYNEVEMKARMENIKTNGLSLPTIICGGEVMSHDDLSLEQLFLFQVMFNMRCTFKAFVIYNKNTVMQKQELSFEPTKPESTCFTEDDAKVLWPDMINYKSIKALCLSVQGGYSVFNKRFDKEDIVKAINNYRTVVETVLDSVWNNGPARNVYNLAPFVRAYVKYPNRIPEILRAVKCFSRMMDSITNGTPLNKIYQDSYMSTFEDYCKWHKENNVTKSSSEKKAEASLYCAVALKAYLDKCNGVEDFRYTVVSKDPFDVNVTKSEQIEMAL